ncbi:MAG: OmpH family outer membrane protein [Spirosomaceae bacterium]|nr:OmpH family outer membrane protein [Spirosomataceae bacterium]
MKNIFLIALISLFSVSTFAQTSKVGTVENDYILSKMPSLVTAQDSLKVYQEKLNKQLAEKTANYDKILKEAQAVFESMSDAEKKAKQEELAGLDNDLTSFRRNGSQLIEFKQNDVLRPLYQKISENIAIVAKQLGYTQILNIGDNNNLAYIDPAFDITNLVLVNMGIKVTE